MLQQEAQIVVDFGEGRIDDFGRHEIGHHFLHPHVVEPAHRHQIAEPHVRGFVRDGVGAAQELVLGGGFVEHQAWTHYKKIAPGCSMPPNWNEGIRTKSNLPHGYGMPV